MKKFKAAATLGLASLNSEGQGAAATPHDDGMGPNQLRLCSSLAHNPRVSGTNEVQHHPHCQLLNGDIVSTGMTVPDYKECGPGYLVDGTKEDEDPSAWSDALPPLHKCTSHYPVGEQREREWFAVKLEKEKRQIAAEDDAVKGIKNSPTAWEVAQKTAAAAAAAAAAASGEYQPTDPPVGDEGEQKEDEGEEDEVEEEEPKASADEKPRRKTQKKQNQKKRNKLLKKAVRQVEAHVVGHDKPFTENQWKNIKVYLFNEKGKDGRLTPAANAWRKNLLKLTFGEQWKTQPDFSKFFRTGSAQRAAVTYYSSFGIGMNKEQRIKLANILKDTDYGTFFFIFRICVLLQVGNMIIAAANGEQAMWPATEMEGDEPVWQQALVGVGNRLPNWLIRMPPGRVVDNLRRYYGPAIVNAFVWIYIFLWRGSRIIGGTPLALLRSLLRNLHQTLITAIGQIPGDDAKQLSIAIMMEQYPDDVPYFHEVSRGQTNNERDDVYPLWDELREIWFADTFTDDDTRGGYKHRTQKRKKKRKKTKKKKKSKKRRKKKHKKTRRKS